MKHIYLAVTNDLITDNRIHKIASTLIKSNAQVTVIGRKKPGSRKLNPRPYKTKRMRLFFKKGAFFYIEYNIRLFLLLFFKKQDIIVANDLDTLLASYIVSKLKNKKLVYDSHEYFTEVPELINRNFQKNIWKIIEKNILPKLKYSYTVSESIANVYNKLYNINMNLVRNTPHFVNKKEIKKPVNTIKTILYQGSVNLGRGLEHMIDAMKFLDNIKLVIIGDGDIRKDIEKRIQSEKLNEKIEMKGQIPFEELITETHKADLGIALEENMGLSYYYSLPNKLFDYIQARVPVLTSPFPEMQKIVNNYNIGTVYEHKSPEELALKITEIFNLTNRYKKWQANLEKAALELCWENEEKILKEIYTRAGLQF